LRASEYLILNIPVDVTGHNVSPGAVAGTPPTPATGASVGLAFTGTSQLMPALTGSAYNATTNLASVPPRRPRDLATPLGADGPPDPKGRFTRSGASTIYREQGKRLIAVKFSVRNRDLAGTVEEAQQAIAPVLKPPYRADWSGEFQEMQEAEERLLL